jgi:hypothetical protein
MRIAILGASHVPRHSMAWIGAPASSPLSVRSIDVDPVDDELPAELVRTAA